MNPKLYHIFFMFLPLFSFGQTCDTLYSHEKYIERSVEIGYRNCYSVEIDTIYRVVQWLNIDTNYLKPYFSENICQSLFHSKTGKLIHERWQENDTLYMKTYYSSGSLKSYSKLFFRENPYYFHDQIIKYYENGNEKYKGEYKSLTLTTHYTYYPNGALETVAKRFSYNPHAFGEYKEYFPNGETSMILNYSEPDTTTDQYQQNTLISEKFYDQTGNESDDNLNEYKKMYFNVYPPAVNEEITLAEDLFSHHQFSDQKAYANDMKLLKDKIMSNIKISSGDHCSKGIAWVSLIINSDGEIKLDEIQFENEGLRKTIEESIMKIKKWPPASLNHIKVDTYVFTYLIIDK